MKNIAYICLLLFIIACSHNNKSSSEVDANLEEPTVLSEIDDKKVASFKHENFTKQKLQDYFDLLILKENYGGFDNKISSQIENLTEDSIQLPKKLDQVLIQNLELIGNPVKLSDSIQKIRLRLILFMRIV